MKRQGVDTLADEFWVDVSPVLYAFETEPLIRDTLLAIIGKSIALPEKLAPNVAFLRRHREAVFVSK